MAKNTESDTEKVKPSIGVAEITAHVSGAGKADSIKTGSVYPHWTMVMITNNYRYYFGGRHE